MTPEQREAIRCAARALEKALNAAGKEVCLRHDQCTMQTVSEPHPRIVHSITISITTEEVIA